MVELLNFLGVFLSLLLILLCFISDLIPKYNILVAMLMFLMACAPTKHPNTSIQYPITKKVNQNNDYHGITISDPYRWLEKIDSKETTQWVFEQNNITYNYLNSLPYRDEIKEQLTKLYDYPRISTPFKKGNKIFYYKNSGLQNQSVLFYKESNSEIENILIDPNKLSSDGTTALSMTKVSEDGNILAYGLSNSGSDWKELFVRNINTGEDFIDHLQWVKWPSVSWLPDNSGFFYSRYPKPIEGDEYENINSNQMVYFHTLGTNQSEDSLIYSDINHPQWGFSSDITDDGAYLLLYVWEGTRNENLVYYKNRNTPEPFKPLISDWIGSFNIIGNDGSIFYIITDYLAPKNRIIKIDTKNPYQNNWIDIIPKSEYNLRKVKMINNEFICIYNRDIIDYMEIYSIDGKFKKVIQLPGLGTISSISGIRKDNEMFFGFTSYLYPNTVFHHDFNLNKTEIFIEPEIQFDPTEFISKQIFYYSKDSTKIPMFIIHHKGLNKTNNNPTYLYGYGGFNVGIYPRFSVSIIPWLEKGGVYAVANIRGGSEYGEEWHKAGMLKNKQNVFDDFIAAGEYLINNNYTSNKHLTIGGGSNGGLLVAAVMIQKPDLFAAVDCGVPVTDMFRYNKFTIGWAWESDYGSPESLEYFSVLHKYSPLHNVKENHNYPPILITTSDHDDRVVPSHSYKFISTLQEKSISNNPQLIRIETKAGHGAGLPISKRIDQKADIWAFLLYHSK